MAEQTSSTPGATTAGEVKKTTRIQKVGRVVSDKMQKTIVVEVDYPRRHRLYNHQPERFDCRREHKNIRAGIRLRECLAFQVAQKSRPRPGENRFDLRPRRAIAHQRQPRPRHVVQHGF